MHYKEEQFHKSPSSEVLETLISINNKLQNKEASAGKNTSNNNVLYVFCNITSDKIILIYYWNVGLLEYAMKNYGNHLRVQEQWYEKLHDWEKALELYNTKLETNPDDIELSIGQMRCLEGT